MLWHAARFGAAGGAGSLEKAPRRTGGGLPGWADRGLRIPSSPRVLCRSDLHPVAALASLLVCGDCANQMALHPHQGADADHGRWKLLGAEDSEEKQIEGEQAALPPE